MKECKYNSVKLLGLIDEYGFCRTMAQVMNSLGCEDTENYKERTSECFKEILEIIKDLDERGAFDGNV